MRNGDTALSIGNIVDPALDSVSSEPDQTTKRELRNWHDQEGEARLIGILQDISERKKYAFWIFLLVACWLAGMIGFLVLQGFRWKSFELPEPVVITVITTTTAGVIGLLVVVVKYLFPAKTESST